MKQIFRIFTLIAVAMLTAGQVWADGETDLGFINIGTVSGGMPMFYKEATCEHPIYPNSNLSSSDLTDVVREDPEDANSAIIGYRIYIKPSPFIGYTSLGVTITAQVSISSSSLEARAITRGTEIGIGDAITVSPVSGKPGIYSFTMPTDGKNVTVSATFKEKPYLGDGTNAHISYISYDAQGNRVTSNTGDDGHPRVYILDGSETTLGQNGTDPATSKPYETWYVCNSTTGLSYTSTLRLYGTVHLILADNAVMTMDVNGPAISSRGDFYIYGQSDGDNIGKLIATSDKTGIYNTSGNITITGGQVEATGTTGAGIVAKNDITITGGQVTATGESTDTNGHGILSLQGSVTISGGQVTATGSGTDGHGIVAINNVTISGGQVTATGSDTNGYGIISLQGGVTISGGQVTAAGDTKGIISRDIIVLGWTNANDYIKVSKYSGSGIVKTAAGQRFVAYNMTSETDISATTIVSGSIANNNFTLADIDGKTLKPLDGYTVTVADGISVGTLSGTTFTAADPDFTITTGAGTESEVTTPYYIFKASTEQNPVTVTLGYSSTASQVSVDYTATKTSDNSDVTSTVISGSTLTMPGYDISIGAKFYMVNVPYIDWDETNKVPIPDAVTLTDTKVYVLNGNETTLGQDGTDPVTDKPYETWYVCNSTTGLSYTSTLTLYGDVHLILADKATMSINVNGPAINGSGDFYIYGQSNGENIGKLIATSDGICFYINDNLYVNGGQVEATGTGTNVAGIAAYNNVTISGGQVTAIGSGTNVAGIVAKNDVTINGGQVTATGSDTNYGITSKNIVLGWTNANDFIKVSSYSSQTSLKTADGQRFVAYTPGATESDPMTAAAVISGTVTNLDNIDGKMLKPIDGYFVIATSGISIVGKDADFTIGTIPCYIYKANTQEAPVTVTLSYGGTDFVTLGGLPEGTTLNAVANQPMQRSFAMPAEDLALTATAVTGLTASGDTYTYDGTAKTPTVKLGDDVFAATNYVVAYKKGGSAVSEAKKAGTYSCTVNGSGSYIGTIATDVAITINPKTVTVTGGITASNKTYDGKTTATLSGKNAVISGKVDGDNLGVSASGAFANKNAGNNKTVNINSITLTGSDKDNYVLATTTGSNQATTTANISKKALTVTADDKSVSYGDAAPTYTASYSGFVSGESKSNSDLSGSLGFSCSYTSSSNTGNYTIKPSGLSSSNYNISYTNGTLTVGAKNVSYTGGTITKDQNGYTVSLDEGTGSANPLPDDADLYKLTYSRTLTAPGSGKGDVTIGGQAAKLYTVCLPFTPETDNSVKYYTLSSVSGETVSFEEVTSPAANTPYLVAVTGSTNITESCTSEVVTSMEINTTTKNGYTFTGTFTGLTNSQAVGKHILQSKNKWCVVESGSVFIPPFRAYIESASGARELTGSFEGEDDATGIVNIRTTDADGTERWYDLNGRRIDQPTKKGIYIRNGKKEIKK